MRAKDLFEADPPKRVRPPRGEVKWTSGQRKTPWVGLSTDDPVGDLGATTTGRNLRRFIDTGLYQLTGPRRKWFTQWVAANGLVKNNQRVMFDKKGDPQVVVTYHPEGNPNDIWAYQSVSGMGSNAIQSKYVRKDLVNLDDELAQKMLGN